VTRAHSFQRTTKTISTFTLTLVVSAIFSVTAAAQPSLGTNALLEGPAAGSDSVVLATAAPTDTWSATANASWLHLSVANQSGTGSTNVVFSYDANPSATRTNTLTIAGQTLTVTQAGSTYVAAPAPVTTPVSSGLCAPAGAVVNSAGNVYFADMGNLAFKKWIATNNTVTTLATWSLPGPFQPNVVPLDAAGNAYIAGLGPYSSGEVQEWTAANGNFTILNFPWMSPSWGVAVDRAGNVYRSSANLGVVDEWTAANHTGATLIAGLGDPNGLAVDGAGNLYIADADEEIFREEVHTTYLHELGHYLGLDEDDLFDRGLE
jgi:hypothetical protein